eukprot:PhF_6_TR11605/c0_g1_i1/m.18817
MGRNRSVNRAVLQSHLQTPHGMLTILPRAQTATVIRAIGSLQWRRNPYVHPRKITLVQAVPYTPVSAQRPRSRSCDLISSQSHLQSQTDTGHPLQRSLDRRPCLPYP